MSGFEFKPGSRYSVQDTGRLIDGNAKVFLVADRNGSPPVVQVWKHENAAYCTKCSGPLSAMRTSCAHAKAVNRHCAASAKRILAIQGEEQ